MKEWKQILGGISLIIGLEVLVFNWSGRVAELETIHYSLAARWSARISLVMLFYLSVWVSISGLKKIFQNEKHRDEFIMMVSLVAFNHLIHFAFLYINHEVNGFNLWTLRSAGGALGYVLLTLAPIYLWRKKQLTQPVYWKTMGTLILLLVIAVVSYLGRWNKDLPMASPKELYIGIMAVAIVLLILNVYRIFADRNKSVKTIDH